MILSNSFNIAGAIEHLLRLPVTVPELCLAAGALVYHEVGDLLDGVNQVEADKNEDLGQGKRLNDLRKLAIVKIKLQEPVNLS